MHDPISIYDPISTRDPKSMCDPESMHEPKSMRDRFLYSAWIMIVSLVFLSAGCMPSQNPAAQQPVKSQRSIGGGEKPSVPEVSMDLNDPDKQPHSVTPTEPVLKERIDSVTLAAVGDVLIHSSIYKDAKTAEGYDFRPMFAKVKPYITAADLAIANQESMIGGEAIGLSDYPMFNSPFEVGDALKDAGFDVVSMANNHTLDRGEQAILNAIGHWKRLGMVYVGAYESEEDRRRIRIAEKNGISFAFLAYTYGTNGIPVPEGKPYLVNLIEAETVEREIREARGKADVVIVNVHFGQEYARMPDGSQKTFATMAAEAGADIIIGHHPHVLQPVEWIETASGRKSFVIYSLGNFIAAQEGPYKRTGGILQLRVEKKTVGPVSEIAILEPGFIPTWISMKNWRQYEIVPLREVTEKQWPDAAGLRQDIANHMKQWVPELRIE